MNLNAEEMLFLRPKPKIGFLKVKSAFKSGQFGGL